jgi:DNA-binding transcriptional LysR family regulator
MIPAELDLNLLRLLVALDGTRHVGRAAAMLDMSQSGFSTALGRLRHQVGDDVFIRSAGGMRPTPRALPLIEAAREVLDRLDRELVGLRGFDAATAATVFRVSMTEVAEVVLIPAIIRLLAQEAPRTTILVGSPSTGPLVTRLASGDIDVAIGYFPDLQQDSVYQQPLFDQSYACIVRTGHPVATSGLTAEAYAALGHVVVASPTRSNAAVEEALRAHRIRRRIVCTTTNHLSLPAIIAASDLIATVPLGAAEIFARAGEVTVLALPFPPPGFTMFQYWHRRTQQDPAYSWLRSRMAVLFSQESGSPHGSR